MEIEFDVASNPEFLKEGNAVDDFMKPDRVVVGVESEQARKLMEKLYKPFMMNNYRLIFTDVPSAEMIKYAANSMLATRISFMNDIANLCELVGADVNMVRKGIGADSRIGSKFLYPGCGYGGSCFPKDVKALIKTAEKNGYAMRVLKAVEDVNQSQKEILFCKLKKYLPDLAGRTIALWGLAFKPETDDMREATALVMIDLLTQAGVKVRVYDPIAMPECRRRMGDKVEYAKDMYDAIVDADALLLLTEWKEFRMPSWNVLKKLMKQYLLIDGRNIYDANELKEQGFIYECIGKQLTNHNKKIIKSGIAMNRLDEEIIRLCRQHAACCTDVERKEDAQALRMRLEKLYQVARESINISEPSLLLALVDAYEITRNAKMLQEVLDVVNENIDRLKVSAEGVKLLAYCYYYVEDEGCAVKVREMLEELKRRGGQQEELAELERIVGELI